MRFALSTLTLLLASTALAHPSPSPKKDDQKAKAKNGTANAAKCDPVNVAKLVGGIQANLNIQSQELAGVLKLQKLVAANSAANGAAAGANNTATPPAAADPAAAAAAADPAAGAYGAPADPAAAAPPADPAKNDPAKNDPAKQDPAKKDGKNDDRAKNDAQKAQSAFAAEQASVLLIQQAGIDFRAQNQLIAQQINSPAQDGLAIVAKAQVQEITQVQGLTGDAATDDAVLKMLVQEVQDGTKQNEKNLKDAESQCA